MNEINQFSGYRVSISTEPSYYGSDCSSGDAVRIVNNLDEMIRNEFPGIQTQKWNDGAGSSATTGPDETVVAEINRWISENWTAAL